MDGWNAAQRNDDDYCDCRRIYEEDITKIWSDHSNCVFVYPYKDFIPSVLLVCEGDDIYNALRDDYPNLFKRDGI